MASVRNQSGRFVKKRMSIIKKRLEKEPMSDNQMEEEIHSWREGRRIVEIGLLADQLKCDNIECAEYPLNLNDIVSENKFGLASFFGVKCNKCGIVKSVCTGKRHRADATDRSARCFDVNTKLAAAITNAGVGESQMSNILAELNIPYPTARNMKKREREVGPIFEKLAQQSTSKAIKDEQKCIEEKNDDGATLVLDGGWQKRGSGRGNNSLSGHVTVFGYHTRRVIDHRLAKKTCRMCKSSKRRASHMCRRNFNGSAKAMESFLALNSVRTLTDNGLKVKRVVMDDDSSTFYKLKAFQNDDITKCSDKNHIERNFNNELYKMRDTHKTLTKKHIDTLKKNFNYAISSNPNNINEIEKNLRAIIPHAYGTHELCDDRHWCTFHDDPELYAKKPRMAGKIFTDTYLKVSLERLLDRYLVKNILAKLANLESSNIVENMNGIVARKAPKGLHLSGSESLDYRLAAAVLQKNEGHSYLCKVNEEHGLSPGKITKARTFTCDNKLESRRHVQHTAAFKKRRLQLKEEKRQGQELQESLEGPTYGVDMPVMPEPEILVELPEPLRAPAQPSIGITKHNIVVFDLETTGFGITPDIIQLAALAMDSGEIFSRYVYPSIGIVPQKVTTITGITACNQKMWHYGKPVNFSSKKEAFDEFLGFLKRFEPAVLVAHNVLFDSKVLLYSLKKQNCLYSTINYFGDTLSLFKKLMPERKIQGLRYGQEQLVKDILGKEYRAHSAVDDVEALCALLRSTPGFEKTLPVYSTHNIECRIQRTENQKKLFPYFADVIGKGVATNGKCKSLAAAGLSLSHLKIVWTRSGTEGLLIILKQVLASANKMANSLSEYFSGMATAHKDNTQNNVC